MGWIAIIIKFATSKVGMIVIGALLLISLIAYIRYDARQTMLKDIAIDAAKQKEKARHEREGIDSDTRDLSNDRVLECLRTPSKC